jgi:hypothetical protein
MRGCWVIRVLGRPRGLEGVDIRVDAACIRERLAKLLDRDLKFPGRCIFRRGILIYRGLEKYFL